MIEEIEKQIDIEYLMMERWIKIIVVIIIIITVMIVKTVTVIIIITIIIILMRVIIITIIKHKTFSFSVLRNYFKKYI
jgi:hypothetical protein